jgi:hypothetical protein
MFILNVFSWKRLLVSLSLELFNMVDVVDIVLHLV